MGDAIIILIVVVLLVFAARSYRKKLSYGCCGAGSGPEKKVRVRDKNPEHYPYLVTIGVEGMSCSKCKERVENALNVMEGVWAEVSLEEKTARVRMKERISDEDLAKTITRKGYEVTGIREE